MKKIVCFAATILAAAGIMTACGESNPFGANEFSVEYGETFALPEISADYEVTSVTDSAGNPVALRYGSFIPKIGDYAVSVTVNGKSYDLKVVCADTVAPKVRFERHVIDAEAGETVAVPALLTEDRSGIETKTIVVTDSAGATVEVTDNRFTAITGVYTVTATASDPSGNTASDTVKVTVHDEFYDTTLAAGTLASFASPNYAGTVYSVDDVECFVPEIESGALTLSTSAGYADVYATIRPPVRDFNFGKTGSVKVKVKADRATDYVKIVSTKTGKTAGAEYGFSAGEEREIEVDPVVLGYGAADRFTIVSRSDGGLKLTVSSVTATENKIDAGYNGTEDFSGETPLARVFRNIYTSSYYSGFSLWPLSDGGGSKFSIADKYFYGSDQPVRVLRVETSERNDGFAYMFPRAENIDSVASISITLSHEAPLSGYAFGVFHDEYRVSKYVSPTETQSGVRVSSIKAGATNERRTVTIPVSDFRDKCDTLFTGFWLSVYDTSDKVNAPNVINVERITLNYKK